MWGEERPTLLKRPKERLAVFRDRSFGSCHLRLSSAMKSSTFRSRHLISALCVVVLTLLSSLQAHAQTTYEKEQASGEMYDEAYEVLMKMDVLGDSLYSVKLSDALAEAQVRYDTEKQQAEIKATRTQRNLFIALAVTAGVALVVAVWFFAYRIRRKEEIAQERIKTLEKEKEVMSLQSMLYAQEEERQRIARDLHDSIGALLSATKLHITNIVAEVQKLEELEFLRSTEEALDRANSEVRRVAHDMMPGVLMKLGLMEGIEDFFDRVRASSNLKITFDYKEPTERLDTKKEVMIYRIIQELVNNTIKHAEASEILLTIRDQGDQWIMNYVDDGKGFDVSKIDDATSFGLSGLRSRVNFLQGSFDVDSKPGEGVRFSFEFPA